MILSYFFAPVAKLSNEFFFNALVVLFATLFAIDETFLVITSPFPSLERIADIIPIAATTIAPIASMVL